MGHYLLDTQYLFLGVGELIHVYQTGQPQTTALNSVGLQKESNVIHSVS